MVCLAAQLGRASLAVVAIAEAAKVIEMNRIVFRITSDQLSSPRGRIEGTRKR
jgi:hypothetical protein